MKSIIYFLFTCFISTGFFMAALGSKTPLLLYAAGFGIWTLFLWGLNRRIMKQAEKRDMERKFRDFMRH